MNFLFGSLYPEGSHRCGDKSKVTKTSIGKSTHLLSIGSRERSMGQPQPLKKKEGMLERREPEKITP